MADTDATIIGLHHLQLEAPSACEEEARAFYQGILGLEEIEKPAQVKQRGGVWFTCGSQQIHIGVTKSFEPRRVGHPALEVRGIAAWRTRLTDAHVPISEDVPLPGWSRFFIHDPWGNRIEILEISE